MCGRFTLAFGLSISDQMQRVLSQDRRLPVRSDLELDRWWENFLYCQRSIDRSLIDQTRILARLLIGRAIDLSVFC